MRIVVAAVGRIKERGIREAIDDYLRRLERYARVEEVELKDGDAAQVEARFRKLVPARSWLVALEVEGRSLTSEGLAEQVARAEGQGVSALVFAIGGAYGLPAALSRDAALRLSLSAMTLPHRLARLVLAEQLYRAYTILRGEPYAH